VSELASAPSTRTRRRGRVEVALLLLLVAFPWIPGAAGLLSGVNQAAVYTVVAASLVLLTGWVGQISLAQAALVGVGAYATGWASGTLGIPFPLNLPIGAAAAALVAATLGVVALRVRGLYLAVATLVFSWAASEFLFRQPWVLAQGTSEKHIVGGEGSLLAFDFSGSRLAFYYAAWATAVIVLYGLTNLRDSKTGRAFFAIRGSEVAAASLGMNVLRYKALAFALSGALAGIAGNLVITHARVVSPDAFTFNQSMFFLAIAVVGGISSLGGAVTASFLFASLSEIFFRFPAVSSYLQLISTGLLAVTFRVYPGGIARLAATVAAKLRVPAVTERAHAVGRRLRPPRQAKEAGTLLLPTEQPVLGAQIDPPPVDLRPQNTVVKAPAPASTSRDERAVLIEASDVVVQFGGLVAVNHASLTVREGEIVGLIGPNGAGKTTLFNAIAGFNSPTAGAISLYGHDVTSLPVHRRAELGVGRTFQLIQLFPQLSVFDNLLAATHLQNPTGFVQHVCASGPALQAEAAARRRVARVVDLLELTDVAHRPTAGLPFGVLRMVEVARALVTGARVVMLDEPASGLDNRETDRLIEVLRFVRELGATLLLIEHDVRMVTSVSDHLYVLDRGKIIAEGGPAAIQNDPAVISAYLGRSAGAESAEPAREPVAVG
jgi:ABC-type branched-subunit amino acid transport system ATPase component/ABC-type branched-subunit amino acid transport system permease subunit